MAGTYFLVLIALCSVIYFNDEVKAACGGLIEEVDGVINYDASVKNCAWEIKTTPNYLIVLHIENYDITGRIFFRDHVNVTIKSKMEDGQVLDHETFYGAEIPTHIISESNVLLVELKSKSLDVTFSMDFYSVTRMLVEENSGVITSPLYPKDYPPNQKLLWEIRMPPNNLVKLNFKHFDLDEKDFFCKNDYVILKSKLQQGSHKEHGKFCNSYKVPNILSESNTLLILFRSDDNYQRSGFEIEYFRVSTECGGMLNTSEGLIVSPQYPSNYPPDVNCTWTILAPLNHNIKLDFTEFSTEGCSDCRDSVTVQSKMANGDLIEHGVFCGRHISPLIMSESNTLSIQLKSNREQCKEVQYKRFLAKFSSVTRMLIEGTSGVITSPLYPLDYPPNQRLFWEIRMPPNNLVKLNVKHFDVGEKYSCEDDYVILKSKLQQGSHKEYRKFCNSYKFSNILSESNHLLIEFNSDGNNQRSGFEIEYFRVSNECGGMLNTSEGLIVSPQYPSNYPPDVNCTWTILAPLNHNIKLEFTEFRTEEYRGCRLDSVTVQSKMANGGLREHGVFCGDKLPPAIISESNILLIKLKSIREHRYKRFLAKFSSEGCGGLLEGSTGNLSTPFFPYPYPHNKTCEWTILVPPQHKVKLHFLQFEIEEGDGCPNDFLQIQSNSTNGEIHDYGKFCGASRPASITSRDTLLLKFVSDLSIKKIGFKAEFIIDKLTGQESSNLLTTRQQMESAKEKYILTVCRLLTRKRKKGGRKRKERGKNISRFESQYFNVSSSPKRKKGCRKRKEGGKIISSLSERQLLNDCGKFIFHLRRRLDLEL